MCDRNTAELQHFSVHYAGDYCAEFLKYVCVHNMNAVTQQYTAVILQKMKSTNADRGLNLPISGGWRYYLRYGVSVQCQSRLIGL